jgi:hypothetical protein
MGWGYGRMYNQYRKHCSVKHDQSLSDVRIGKDNSEYDALGVGS